MRDVSKLDALPIFGFLKVFSEHHLEPWQELRPFFLCCESKQGVAKESATFHFPKQICSKVNKENTQTMKTFTFSKGEFRIENGRLVGTVKASTSMQQAPGQIEVDTPVNKVGPISINEVPQFRHIATGGAVMGVELIATLIWGITAICSVSSSSSFEQLANASEGSCNGAIWAFAIGTPLAIVAAVLAWKKVRVFMAQFSNAGQTLYVPYLKKDDYPVIKALDAELAKGR